MPGVTRRRRTLDEEDDDEVSSDYGAQSNNGTPLNGANKRARLNPEDEPGTPQSGLRTSAPRAAIARQNGNLTSTHRVTAAESSLQHQPGSIVRVSVKDFVTYTAADFEMGPALNMVIGPNGTGKSTLVCAICLGLGSGTKVLARAKDISEFVKHGRPEAEIEIELKGHPGKINPVIRRNIKRDGNKSSWYINGQSTTHKDVSSIVKGFSIQIDNLCQFLPQDRVVEFAQLSPVDLLKETQRAAAPPQVTEWHEQLKGLRADQRQSEKNQGESKQNLVNLENRQNLQRGDVERMRERAELQEKVALLEKTRPFAFYTIAKELLDKASKAKSDGEFALSELSKEVTPSLRAMDDKQKYVARISEVVNQKTKLLERAQSAEEEVEREFKKAGDTIKECQNEKAGEKKSMTDRKRDISTAERSIHLIKEQMREEPIQVDLPAFNEKSREKTRQMRELEDEISDRHQAKKDRNFEIGSRQQRITHANEEIQNLRSQAGQQTNKLRNISRDTASAWEWIQQNQDKFKSRVYGPPVVECTVQDKRYVDSIESLFQTNALCAITCTDRDDFRLLSSQLYREMRLHDITLRTCMIPLANHQAPVSDEEMRALGLEGWALDYISGPDPVLSMLCGEQRLHQTGVILGDITDQQYASLEASAVTSWVTSKASYQITRRREYGPGAVSTRVRDVNPARMWTEQPVDLGADRQLREEIDTCQTEMDDLKKLQSQVDAGIQELKSQVKVLQKEKDEIETEKGIQQKVLSAFRALPSRLATQEQKLAKYRSLDRDVRKKMKECERKETDAIIKKGQLTVDYQRKVELAQQMHTNLISASIARIEAQSDLETLATRNADVQAQLRQKEQEVQQLEADRKRLKDEARALGNAIKTLTTTEPLVRAFWENQPAEERNRSPEQLEIEIESLNARLESLHGGNSGVIKEYERREKEIDKLKSTLTGLEANLTELDDKIKEIRDQWEPQLDALVAQISSAFATSFEKINCAGAVSVFKGGSAEGADRDFDTWAIQVQVRFREGEQMSILDSHRQSGGERAVSTIFYLMALQTLSRAPFRVVDEINQGMDPRNERMVHERMVDIACGGEGVAQSSQYSLITPKLLTGLKYVSGMKIHCIASGEFMPKDGKELDFKALLNRVKMSGRAAIEAAA